MGPRSGDAGPGRSRGWALRLPESWEELGLDSEIKVTLLDGGSSDSTHSLCNTDTSHISTTRPSTQQAQGPHENSV